MPRESAMFVIISRLKSSLLRLRVIIPPTHSPVCIPLLGNGVTHRFQFLLLDLARRVCLLISDHCSALAFSSEMAINYPEWNREIKSVGITPRALDV